MTDPNLQRWIDDPDFLYLSQDMDLILMSAFTPLQLCQLMRSPKLNDEKKSWVISALVEVVEHHVVQPDGETDQSLLEMIRETLNVCRALCLKTLPDLGVGNDEILASMIGSDQPNELEAIVRKRSFPT